MKYKILTDHWKANLYEGDIIPGDMYSEAVLERACGNRYIEPYEAEKPTMDDYKDDIIEYLKDEGIEHDTSSTKSELLDLIE